MNNDTSTPGTHRPQRQGRPATPRRRIGIGLIAVVVVAMCAVCGIAASGAANQTASVPTATANSASIQSAGVASRSSRRRPGHRWPQPQRRRGHRRRRLGQRMPFPGRRRQQRKAVSGDTPFRRGHSFTAHHRPFVPILPALPISGTAEAMWSNVSTARIPSRAASVVLARITAAKSGRCTHIDHDFEREG